MELPNTSLPSDDGDEKELQPNPDPKPDPKPTPSWLCRLIGHENTKSSVYQYPDGTFSEIFVNITPLKFCQRCGTPNPNYAP